jgi:RecG-like helicase
MSKIRRKSTEQPIPELPPLTLDERGHGPDVMPIGEVAWRKHVRVAGKVRSVRIQPWSGVATLECILVDGTGGISVVFLGRRRIAGIHPGSKLTVEGTVGEHAGRLAILNPDYEIELLPEH